MTLQMHDQAAHQKRMAQEARIHHAALEEASGDVRLHVTRAGAVSFVDPQVRSKLHLSRRDLSGRGFFERILLADRPVLIKALGDCLARHELQIVQVQFHLRDDMLGNRQAGGPRWRDRIQQVCAVVIAAPHKIHFQLLGDGVIQLSSNTRCTFRAKHGLPQRRH